MTFEAPQPPQQPLDIPTPAAIAPKTEANPFSFRPGDLEQDVYTMPLEIGLIAVLNAKYSRRSHTLFPVFDEAHDKTTEASTYPRSRLFPLAVLTSAGIFAGLWTADQEHFPIWLQARGLTHSVLLTELGITSSKIIFQKKRPNYDAQVAANGGEEPADARASFYSGHAAHAFNFATYTSLMMWRYAHSTPVAVLYTAAATGAAGVIAYSRIPNPAHNPLDVCVGAIMGTTTAAWTFLRVQQQDPHNWQLTPHVAEDTQKHLYLGLDFDLET
jgi:membrane-associated phospholipid phosphatase